MLGSGEGGGGGEGYVCTTCPHENMMTSRLLCAVCLKGVSLGVSWENGGDGYITEQGGLRKWGLSAMCNLCFKSNSS